jgi:hypothetical protein
MDVLAKRHACITAAATVTAVQQQVLMLLLLPQEACMLYAESPWHLTCAAMAVAMTHA